jgi:hypothetical protein
MQVYVLRGKAFTVARLASGEFLVTTSGAPAGFLIVDERGHIRPSGRYSNVVDGELDEVARLVADDLQKGMWDEPARDKTTPPHDGARPPTPAIVHDSGVVRVGEEVHDLPAASSRTWSVGGHATAPQLRGRARFR